MRIKNVRTGELYVGFDALHAIPIWAKIKCATTQFDQDTADAIVRQLRLLDYHCEVIDDEE